MTTAVKKKRVAEVKKKRVTTPPKIAAEYGWNPAKVIAWIESGELKAFDSATKRHGIKTRYMVYLDDLEAFIESRRPTPPVPVVTKSRRSRAPGEIEFYP